MKRTGRAVNLFLDSGAFSAWTQKTTINIKDYIAFIKEHEQRLVLYANLDVIGLGGKTPNEITAEQTLRNQKIMEEAGLHPLPCFHFGEPEKYLQYYVENYEYIALGVAGNSGNVLIPWLNRCFAEFICGDDGFPKVKVHGFAVTSLKIMLRYPWYSVDSTSWALTGGMGSIYVPRFKNGTWVYDENSWKVAVSSLNPKMKNAGQHISTIPLGEKQVILDYIHSKGYVLGKSEFKDVKPGYQLAENERWAEGKPMKKEENGKLTLDRSAKRKVEVLVEKGVSNMYQLRDELNIVYFQDLERFVPAWPWKFDKQNIQNGFDGLE